LYCDVDIYAPCAMGLPSNNNTVYKLKAKVIAGAANNQLADENVHGAIQQKNFIMHLIFNADAGNINVYAELIIMTEQKSCVKQKIFTIQL
jgi:leucine dehydrogenase